MVAKNERWYSTDWTLILCFASAGLAFHFITFDNFELHRDAYLYYAQSEHLAWGYWSVPPLTSIIGRIATLIFGNTVFGMRFFPTLICGSNIILIGMAVKELGGRKTAIALASLAYMLSPAYLHADFVFQPICFEHFFWLLSGYLILVMIKRNNPAMWIWLGIVFGLGFLNKYSIVFFYTAFGISLLISPYKNFYGSKYFLFALAIGFVIILPNLIWQYLNNWPVLIHMAELRESQLVHVKISDFILEQFMMNAQAVFIWFGALVVLLFVKAERQYRMFGFIYLFIVVLLIAGSGKSYYTLGVYPVLFAFGAYFMEKYSKKYLPYVFSFLVVWMGMGFYISLSFDGIPVISVERAVKKDAYRWEDGTYHDLSQDMADMTGWKELGEKVRDVWMNLEPEQRADCDIYCYHYGQYGAVMFYGKQDRLPQPISFNGSAIFWSPDSLTKNYMIWVHFDEEKSFDVDSLLTQRFETVTLKETIENRYFRESGTRIYLCEDPTEEYRDHYKALANKIKSRYR